MEDVGRVLRGSPRPRLSRPWVFLAGHLGTPGRQLPLSFTCRPLSACPPLLMRTPVVGLGPTRIQGGLISGSSVTPAETPSCLAQPGTAPRAHADHLTESSGRWHPLRHTPPRSRSAHLGRRGLKSAARDCPATCDCCGTCQAGQSRGLSALGFLLESGRRMR